MNGGAVSFTSISCALTGERKIRDKDIEILWCTNLNRNIS